MLKDEYKNRSNEDGSKPSKSHTQNTARGHDQRIVALVRFIARRAAEEDYKELLRALNNTEEE